MRQRQRGREREAEGGTDRLTNRMRGGGQTDTERVGRERRTD